MKDMGILWDKCKATAPDCGNFGVFVSHDSMDNIIKAITIFNNCGFGRKETRSFSMNILILKVFLT